MKDLQVDVIINYSMMTMKNKHLPNEGQYSHIIQAFIKVDILAAVSSSVEKRNILVALPIGSGH